MSQVRLDSADGFDDGLFNFEHQSIDIEALLFQMLELAKLRARTKSFFCVPRRPSPHFRFTESQGSSCLLRSWSGA